ncbi:phage head-tail connector protein [Dolosigranulum pigrum]|uniref:phage head-tail connector protein n=1 Tax=Dolosigranulum pigrum TaxID=29394 RepID=UPI001AD892E2|nr:phage head-tail connector protein [Dolosigranulum pigrum]QTJ54272.1 phage head-tail connector protein [Dolosigranulum pigrum]
MLTKVKTLLGIKDYQQDVLLELIIELTRDQLLALLGREDVPEEIQFIVVEVAVKRFNRLGSEGMSSEAIEGHTMQYYASDFEQYDALINRFKLADKFGDGRRGRVVMI